MTRFTKVTRSGIVTALMKHTFDERIEDLVKQSKAYTNDVYDYFLTEDQQKLMESLPAGWTNSKPWFHLRIGNSQHTLHFNGLSYCIATELQKLVQYKKDADGKYLHEGIGKRLPYSENWTLGVADPLAKRHDDLHNRSQKLLEEYAAAKNKADAAIGSFSSVEKLITEWPEIAPFASYYIEAPGKPKPQLPALHTDVLNQMFKLPVPA